MQTGALLHVETGWEDVKVYNTLAGFGGAIFCLYCVCLRVVLHEVDAPMRSALINTIHSILRQYFVNPWYIHNVHTVEPL